MKEHHHQLTCTPCSNDRSAHACNALLFAHMTKLLTTLTLFDISQSKNAFQQTVVLLLSLESSE